MRALAIALVLACMTIDGRAQTVDTPTAMSLAGPMTYGGVPVVELRRQGTWSSSGSSTAVRHYLFRHDHRAADGGVAVIRLDAPSKASAHWVLSVTPGDCLPDAALPGWRCGLDLVAIGQRFGSHFVHYGDSLFSLNNWPGAAPTRLVTVRQRRGQITVRVDARCALDEWGATCPAM